MDADVVIPIGAIAQLGERLICIQEVVGSIPSGSTRYYWARIEETNSDLQVGNYFTS